MTGEEVQWTMKYWLDEWKVPVTSKKEHNRKQSVEAGTSQKFNSPTTNTRKVVESAKDIGGSVTVRKPRKKILRSHQHRRRIMSK